MGKLRSKLQRFFYGRYGGDTLGNVLLGVYLFVVLSYFIGSLFIPPAAVKTRLVLAQHCKAPSGKRTLLRLLPLA